MSLNRCQYRYCDLEARLFWADSPAQLLCRPEHGDAEHRLLKPPPPPPPKPTLSVRKAFEELADQRGGYDDVRREIDVLKVALLTNRLSHETARDRR